MFKKTSIVLTTLTLLSGVPADAKTLRGDEFITAMDGNTLPAKAPTGCRSASTSFLADN